MRDLHCRDAGMNCDFVARGSSDQEILDKAGQHAKQAHHLSVTEELSRKLRGLIHDENSEAHRTSMGGILP